MDALTAPPPLPARRLAQQLEASFAAEMLRNARPAARAGSLAGRGTGGDAFDSFMDEALGAALVSRGGMGLTPALTAAITAQGARGMR